EADKVRAQFQHGSRPAGHGGSSSRASQSIAPKIDLSHVSKPGDVMKAILAKKQEQEAEARRSHVPPSKAPTAVVTKAPAKPAAPAQIATTLSAPAAARPVVTVVPPQNVVVKPPTATTPASGPPKPAATEQTPAATKPVVVAPKPAAAAPAP